MVKVSGWTAASVALAMVLAGCAGGPASDADEPLPDVFQSIVVTSTTGAIRGIVISEAIVPIPDATIELAGSTKTQTSTQDGAFAFSGLEPGNYFLKVSKPGYFATQTSTEVVAGVENPPIVKVQLVVDALNQPFTELLTWRAFLQCGAALVAVSTNPCAVADSDNVHDFEFSTARIPELVQVEAIWEGTQPLGNYLNMGFYDPDSLASNWKSVDGTSPLMINATAEEIVDTLGDDADHTTVRLFPGRGADGMNPTLVLNQGYDVYVTHFYGFSPRVGWMFAIDGPCGGPDQCGA